MGSFGFFIFFSFALCALLCTARDNSSQQLSEVKAFEHDEKPFPSFETMLEASGSEIGFADTVQSRIHRRLRICIATKVLAGPSPTSGAAIADAAMSEALAAHPAFNVTVLYLMGDTVERESIDYWVEDYRKRNIRVIALPRPTTEVTADSKYALNSYLAFLYLLDHQKDFDMIRFHEWRGPAYHVTTAKRQGLAFQNTIILSTIHCPLPFFLKGSERFTKTVSEVSVHYLEKLSTEQSDVVVSPSRYMLDWLRREHQWKFPPQTFAQQNILKNEVLQSVAHTITPSTETQFVEEFVLFGRLEPIKGIFVFADALDIIARLVNAGELRSFSVTFLGCSLLEHGKNAETVLRERAKTGSWPFNLRFLMDFNQPKAISYLRNGPGSIAVMPSLLDNSPYAVMECIALQIPMLASDVGGISEFVHADDRSHVLFRPQPQALAKRLIDAVVEGVRVAKPSVDPFANGRLAQDFHARMLVDFIENPQERVRVSSDDKLVSIFVAFRDDSKLQIIPTIEAVLEQTHTNIELIIINDDEIEDKEFLQKVIDSTKGDPRLGLGILSASEKTDLSTIVLKAKGSFVAFIDAGDYPEKNWIEDLISVQARTQADVVMPMITIYNDDEVPRHLRHHVPIGSAVSTAMFSDVGPYCALWKKSSLDVLQWLRMETGTFEDPALMIHALLKGYRLELIPYPRVLYRERKTNSANRFAKQQRILKQYLDAVPKDLADALTFAYAKANNME